MILTVDINNTSVVYAVMDNGKALFMSRLNRRRDHFFGCPPTYIGF